MATETPNPLDRTTSKATTYRIPIRAIVANTNPRFPLSAAVEKLGYSVFFRTEDADGGERPSLWELATSDNPEHRKTFVDIVTEHDPEFCSWAATFMTQGQLQAAEVRDNGKRGKDSEHNTYTLVFGCRRCLAILYNWCLTGKPAEPTVDAKLSKGNNATLYQRAFIENVRKAPNPIEEAAAIQQWMHMTGQGVDAAAKEFGYSDQTIRNRLELLRLDPKIQEKLKAGTLKPSAALKGKGEESEDGEDKPATPAVLKTRSRKVIEEAAAEYAETTPVGKVLAWVLGKRDEIE